jgi:Sec-independent protein translocase protein TatA
MPLALLLDSVGPGEWLLLFLVALVVYGPRRLPGLARNLGRWIARINQAAEQLREQVAAADLEDDGTRNPAPPAGTDAVEPASAKPQQPPDTPGEAPDR